MLLNTDGNLQEAAAVNAPRSTPVLCKRGRTSASPEAGGRRARPSASADVSRGSNCQSLLKSLCSAAEKTHSPHSPCTCSCLLFVKDRSSAWKKSSRCGKRKEKRGRTPTAMCSFLLVLVGRHGPEENDGAPLV